MRLVTLFAEDRRALIKIIDQGWPAVESADIDGWIVRYSSGVTKRANSVLTVSAPQDVEASIMEVERRSIERWLPASFQVGHFSQPENLDEILEARGYQVVSPTTVQAMGEGDLQKFASKMNPEVVRSDAPNDEWLELFWRLEKYSDLTSQLVSKQILTGVESVFYHLRDPETERIVSIAKMSLVANYGGLYCLYTDPDYRGRGLARTLIESVLADAAERGLEAVWLQVEDTNTGAIVLYNHLGFDTVTRYHYRMQG